MWHLDIPKTRQYDDGKLEVVARNSQGQASCSVELKVTARTDDHRGVLKHSPKRESPVFALVLICFSFPKQGQLVRRRLVTNANKLVAGFLGLVVDLKSFRLIQMITHTNDTLTTLYTPIHLFYLPSP